MNLDRVGQISLWSDITSFNAQVLTFGGEKRQKTACVLHLTR